MPVKMSDTVTWAEIREVLKECMDALKLRRLAEPMRNVPAWLPEDLKGYLTNVSTEFCFGPQGRVIFDEIEYSECEVDPHVVEYDFFCISGVALKNVLILREHENNFYDIMFLTGPHAGSIWNTDNFTYATKIQPDLMTYIVKWLEAIAMYLRVVDEQNKFMYTEL